MATLESSPVEIRFFKRGSVEETESVQQATNLSAALESVQQQFPNAVHVRCCEHETDGGCLFVYATTADLNLDEADAAKGESSGQMPAAYGRWIGIISCATRQEPTCARPSRHSV